VKQTIDFEVQRCNVTGELGLVPQGIPISDDYMALTTGRSLAHDVVEHPNGIEQIGGVGDELEACGAIWYTRGHLHDMERPVRSIYTPEQSMGYELSTNFTYWWQRGCEFEMPVPRSQPSSFDCDLRSIIREGIIAIRDELKYEDEEYRATTKDIAIFMSGAKHFMRSGIAKQQVRFPENQWEANAVFWNLSEAVTHIFKDIDYEGQTFRLECNGHEAIAFETTEDYYDEEEE